MTAEPSSRGRLSRVDPLTFLCCLVALGVYLPHGFDGVLSRDLGVYSYGGQQVADGVAPYVAILNRAGPLAHLVPGIGAAAARLVGVDDVVGMRVLFMLISVACIGLVYLLGRDVFRSRLAGLASAAALLSFQGFLDLATYGPREKTLMVLFLVAALWAVTHQRWASTGALIALATLTWQPVFFAAAAGAVVAILVGVRSGRLRALARVAVGGLVPTVVTLACYAAIGALRIFLDAFVLINLRYTYQSTLFDALPGNSRDMVDGFGWSLWVFLLGLVAVLVLSAGAAFRRPARRDPATAALIGSGVLVVIGLAWSAKAFNNWPDVFLLLPGAALGVGSLAAVLVRRVPLRAAVAATTAWALAATALSVGFSIGTRDDGLDVQRAAVTGVLDLLPADARIASIGAPQALVLSRQRHLSRFQLFGNGLLDYVDDTWPGGSAGYGRWIGSREPTLIAVGTKEVPMWLVPTLAGPYVHVGETGWDWYVRRDVGKDTIKALRTVLRDPSMSVEG